ncbi:MAG TPA: dienelactone hydrolase family protein [Rhodothermales bacterium]|nr:dienelactone hydrolase family protein [Rhodothermales bacterium]
MKHPLFALFFIVTVAACTGCGDSGQDDYADRMAHEHANDAPVPTPITAAPATPVDTSTVQYGTVDGHTVTGYMAVPARPDSALTAMGVSADSSLPGIIVIHEWWGLNDNIKAMARRLAGQGFRALAVDLYDGQVAAQPDQATKLVRQVMQNQGAATENLEAAYRYLSEQQHAPRVGVIGWCFGGGQALQASLALPDEIDATVIYYGHLTTDRGELQTLDMPILAFFGQEDQSIPAADIQAFQQALKDEGKDVQVYTYEGAGHAFANPSGRNYVEEAANDAWQKTVPFLRQHLYPGHTG